MKKFLAAAVLAGAAASAFAQSNQIDVANLFVAADLTAAYPTTSQKGGLLSQKNSTNETTVTYTFTSKIDDSNTVKAGAIADFYLPIVSGTDAKYQAQWAAKVEPFAQYQGFGLDAKFTLPVMTFSPTNGTTSSDNINSGLNAFTGYSVGNKPVLTAGGTYKGKDNTVVLGHYEKVTYKYAFDKTFAVSAGYELDLELTPIVWVSDVLPQFSVYAGPVQFDNKFDFYGNYSDNLSSQYVQFYLEPKLTYDLGSVGVSGLKAYVTGRYSAWTGSSVYANNAWHDSRVQPGVSYTFTVKDIGTFGADTSVRFNRIDYDPNNAFDAKANNNKAGQGDFRLNLTYTYKF